MPVEKVHKTRPKDWPPLGTIIMTPFKVKWTSSSMDKLNEQKKPEPSPLPENKKPEIVTGTISNEEMLENGWVD